MIIKGGRVLTEEGIKELDLRIKDGIIDKKIIDAKGGFVLPGIIDIHTHLDDYIGKYKIADDFYSGSIIAALNGVTTIYNFITENDNRPIQNAISEFLKKGNNSIVNYGFHLTPTVTFRKNIKDIYRLIESGFTSFKFYTTYKNAGIFFEYEEIERFVDNIKTSNTVFLVHCEDEQILSRNYCFDYTNPFDHSLYRPVEAETTAVKMIIEIAARTKGKFHIVHSSTYKTVELVNQAKEKIDISCETCPQYMVLNNELLKDENGHRYFCTPPLRDESERIKLLNAAKGGMIDIFSTDHCPFLKSDKDENRKNLRLVPNGLPGLGALSHIIYENLSINKSEPVFEFSKRLSLNPARIMGIYPKKGVIQEGSDADIIIFTETDKNKMILPALTDSYNPYENFYFRLNFDYVIINGAVVVEDGRLINSKNKGRCINVRE